jgi:hypothetical protein
MQFKKEHDPVQKHRAYQWVVLLGLKRWSEQPRLKSDVIRRM